MHWSEQLLEDRLQNKAKEEIDAQKHAIALAEMPRLESLLHKDIEESVKRLSRTIGEVEGPIQTLDRYTKFRTSKMPLRVVEFQFVAARIRVRTFYQASHEASYQTSESVLRIRGEFNEEPWFEHKGKRLNTIEEVSELLLRPLFESIVPGQ